MYRHMSVKGPAPISKPSFGGGLKRQNVSMPKKIKKIEENPADAGEEEKDERKIFVEKTIEALIGPTEVSQELMNIISDL